MQGMLLQALSYRGKPLWLFLSCVFLWAGISQPACAGADAKRSSNSHSYILDVFARAQAHIKDSGKLWQPWPEGSIKPSQTPPNQFMQNAQMLSSSTSVGNSNAHKERGVLFKKLKQK